MRRPTSFPSLTLNMTVVLIFANMTDATQQFALLSTRNLFTDSAHGYCEMTAHSLPQFPLGIVNVPYSFERGLFYMEDNNPLSHMLGMCILTFTLFFYVFDFRSCSAIRLLFLCRGSRNNIPLCDPPLISF